MREPKDEKIGAAIIRIRSAPGGWRGAVIRKGTPVEEHRDADLRALQTRLRNEAGKLHPDYIGIDGAIVRFLRFFPGGFTDRAYVKDEREYKAKAKARLDDALPLDNALEATTDEAIAVRRAFATNILHSTELARAHELLGGPNGAAYVRSAARFASGDLEEGLRGMVQAIAPHGRPSWPLLTYLPNLWRPRDHMFLKPVATVDFAQRIGHRFQYDYSATPSADVYRSLLDLIADTETAIDALQPEDRTDVQSFIWVVGDYTDDLLPRLEALRASG
ncbi:MAG: hypothetical protein JWN21_1797 [Sphingomonas bacterium]|uniref:hypothetical protein n=1 Tax=Sphingomonas bacterium TaxID=1895847 RepID=UPI00261B359D|nr:hypothetical protein [Sphingomonas bacterium]MDB5696254.1 hypothetical protein [Sphingomonas bacterium]